MSCDRIQSLLSPYLDGNVTGGDMRQISEHLAACPACNRTFSALRATQQAVAGLGRRKAPSELELRIRLALSREASMTPRRRLEGLLVHFENACKAFMVPAAAGALSAVVFFGLLLGLFALPQPVEASTDTLLPAIYMPPELDSSLFNTDLDSGPGALLVEVVVDPNGRMQTYRLISAPSKEAEEALPQLKNVLLFTTFRPARAFGQPTTGRVVLSFSNINVRG